MSITPYLFAQQLLAKSLRIFQVFFKYRWRAHRSGSRDYLVLRNHHTNTKIGKQASGFYASEKWNNLQRLVRFDRLIPFARFKALSAVCEQSGSFLWRVCREQCSYTVKSTSAKKASNKSDLRLPLRPMSASVTNVVLGRCFIARFNSHFNPVKSLSFVFETGDLGNMCILWPLSIFQRMQTITLLIWLKQMNVGWTDGKPNSVYFWH